MAQFGRVTSGAVIGTAVPPRDHERGCPPDITCKAALHYGMPTRRTRSAKRGSERIGS